jgi:photosynthetic reaction center cytochrome c subunit
MGTGRANATTNLPFTGLTASESSIGQGHIRTPGGMMTRRLQGALTFGLATSGIALIVWANVPRTKAAQFPEATAGKTAGEVYKNIKILKDVPADQLIPTMQFISASLGVECDFCHVRGAFDKDEKKPKEVARKMVTMMAEINKDNFEGHREVTCNNCHHGSEHPAAVPWISEEGVQPDHPIGMGGPEAPPKEPAPAGLIEKYVEALGGAEAIEKIHSRVEKGSVTAFGGRQFPIEVYAKAPNQRVSFMRFAMGESVTLYDGKAGWLSFPGGPPHPISGGDLDAAKLTADFYFPVRITELFAQLHPAPPEEIAAKEMYVVRAINPGQPPVKLYFDEQSGLLVRLVHYTDTALGWNPEQSDFADYRETNGVKIPYRWTIARPGSSFRIQIDSVQQNVPIDVAKFVKPEEGAPMPPSKPPAK